MSNFKCKIQIKTTNEIKDAIALDNYFGNHKFGYETVEPDNEMSRIYSDGEIILFY